MAQRIENARQKLMDCGRAGLQKNEGGQYGRLSIRELTTECGIALGTFYRYFNSKEDLVLQILEEDWNQVLDQLDGLMHTEATLYEKVRSMYEVISEFERSYRYSVMSLFSKNAENGAFREKNMQRLYDCIETFLQKEIDRGTLGLAADLDSAAFLLVELIISTARNPRMEFDDLWKCMTFQDKSAV